MLLKYFDSCKEISGKRGLHIQITEMTALLSASFYLRMPLNLLPNTDRWGHEFWRKFPFWVFIAEMSAWKENSKHGFLYSENMASFVNSIRFPLLFILKSGVKTADFEEQHGHVVFLAFFCFSLSAFLKYCCCGKCWLSYCLLSCSSEDFRSWDQCFSSYL